MTPSNVETGWCITPSAYSYPSTEPYATRSVRLASGKNARSVSHSINARM